MILKGKHISGFILISTLLIMNSSYGQQRLSEDEYIGIFINKLDQWDGKKFLAVKKGLQARFERRLKLRLEHKLYEYEDDRWYQEGVEIWNRLPDEVEAKLKISDVSKNLLYAIFHENLPMYMKFIAITELDPDEDLDVPFYGIFGIAYESALKDRASVITARYIGIALEKSERTHHWPECPSPPRKTPPQK